MFESRTAAFLAALVIVFVLAPVWFPLTIHWFGCMQLSPAERFFTRGC